MVKMTKKNNSKKKNKSQYLRVRATEVEQLKEILPKFNERLVQIIPNINASSYDNVNVYLSGSSFVDTRNVDTATDTVLILNNFVCFNTYFSNIIKQLKENGIKEDNTLVTLLNNLNNANIMFKYLSESSDPMAANGYLREIVKSIITAKTSLEFLDIGDLTGGDDALEETPTYFDKVLQDFSESINSLKDTIHSICRDNTIIERFDKSLGSLSRKGPSNLNVKIGELKVLIEGIKSVINSKKITDAAKSLLETLNEDLSKISSGIVYPDAVVSDEVLLDIIYSIKQFNADVNEIQEDKHSTDGEGDNLGDEQTAHTDGEGDDLGDDQTAHTGGEDDDLGDVVSHSRFTSFIGKHSKAFKRGIIIIAVVSCASCIALVVTEIYSLFKPKNKKAQIVIDDPEPIVDEFTPSSSETHSEPTTAPFTSDCIDESYFSQEDYYLGEGNINEIVDKLRLLGIEYTQKEIISIIQDVANGNSDSFSGLFGDLLIPYVDPILQKQTKEYQTLPPINQFYPGQDDILRSRLEFFEVIPETLVKASEDEESRNTADSFVSNVVELTEELFNGADDWFNQAGELERKLYIEALKHIFQFIVAYVKTTGQELYVTVDGIEINITTISLDEFVELLEKAYGKSLTMTPID